MNASQNKAAFLAAILKPGEQYSGILLCKNGEPDQHLILLPGQRADIDWNAAKTWAASVGGELPTRREQSLLFANLKEEFEARSYWSCEPNGDVWAWCQLFGNGLQSDYRTDDALRARAVRRLVIE